MRSAFRGSQSINSGTNGNGQKGTGSKSPQTKYGVQKPATAYNKAPGGRYSGNMKSAGFSFAILPVTSQGFPPIR